MFEKLVTLLLAGAITVSQFIPSSETLRLAFEQGQKLFAIEDYEQAAKKYETVRETESIFLDTDQIIVQIEAFELPIKIAATYQLGNCYHRMAINKYNLATSGEVSPARVKELKKESIEYFRKAANYYKEVAEKTTSTKLKALARYQLVKTRFEGRQYEEVIEESKIFLQEYSTSEYVDQALYELGWAYYYLKRYPEAIQTFSELIQRFPEGYRADRAQFQIGQCYLDLGETGRAREAFLQILRKYQVTKLTEKERIRLETQKLIGVVHETIMELSAKAQILIGDTYLAEGNEEKALEAYETMVRQYPKQLKLVESAYVKMADVYFNRGDKKGGFYKLREAIDRISDAIFRARMQSRIAMKYYDLGDYERAIEELRVYIKGYPFEAKEAGFKLDQAQFQIGQCYYQLGERAIAAEGIEKAKKYYTTAKTEYQKVIDNYPRSTLIPAALLAMGLCEHRIGEPEDLQQALDYFQQITKNFSDRIEYASRALLQTARVYRDLNELDKAIATYREFLSKYPDSSDRDICILELATCLRDADKPDEAVAVLFKIEKDSEYFSKARLLVSEIEIARKNYQQAETALNEALELTKDKAIQDDVHYGLARVFMAKGDYSRAIEEFTIVINNNLKESSVKNAIFGRGFCYYQLKNYQKAKTDLDKLMAIGIPPTLRNQTYRLLGRINVSLGKKEEAIQNYLALIKTATDPNEKAEFLLLLAELYHSIGDYSSSIQVAQQAIDLNFTDSVGERGYFIKERCYFLIGDSYAKMEQYQQAIKAFKTGLTKFPNAAHSPEFLFGIAIVNFSLKNYTETISALNKFLKQYPKNPNRENAYYYLGYSYIKESLYAEAVKAFSSLIKNFPKSSMAAEALFQIGENYFNLREYEKALKAYEGVWRKYPHSVFVDAAMYNVGWCYVELNRMEEAIKVFRQLVRNYPRSQYAPSAQFTLGDYYFNIKQYEKAAQEYEKVVNNYPDSPLAQKAQELLKELENIRAYLVYIKGMKKFDNQEYEEAIKIFQEVIERFPNSDSKAGALCNMGMAYEYLHEWKKAAEVYKIVLKEYANDVSQRQAYVFAKEHHDWVVANRL